MEKELTLKEIQLEQLEILKKTARYIEEKKLSYFLTGGTLIGAIRHKGFIPWDDDIDIGMPREEYDKFMEYIKEEPFEKKYEVQALELNNYNMPYCKVINKDIRIKSKSTEDKFLWIDIFPYDGLPDSEKEFIKLRNKNKFYIGQIYLKFTLVRDIWKEKKPLPNRLLKIILKPIACRHSYLYYSKKIDRISRKYKYSECEHVGNLSWVGNTNGYIKKQWISSLIDWQFEDETFKIPSKYHEYLTKEYGDYMKMPPEEERISHGTKAYKKIEE